MSCTPATGLVGRALRNDLEAVVFDTTMRGYDRGQVDQRIQELVAQLLVTMERAETAERELAQAADDGRGAFGGRIEKMLRIAEHEAEELREEAKREASEILEQARSQAQTRERELDETLAARQAELDERAEELTRDLRAHQKAMVEELAAAREEADSVRGGAAADAASVLDKAQDQARSALTAAETAAEGHHDWLDGEIHRLVSTRDGLHAELVRLREERASIPTAIEDAPDDEGAEVATAPAEPAAAGGSVPEIVRPRRSDDSHLPSALPTRLAPE